VAHKRFEIRGRVIDDATGAGAAGLTVEAWDKDFLADDLVGKETTDVDGRFKMVFDESYFEELFGDQRPDLFFVVFSDGDVLTSTEGSVLWNVGVGTTTVEIHVTLPAPPKVERDIYLKIEPVNDYNPVNPIEHVPAGVKYKRDCMQHGDHHNGVIPDAEVGARAVEALVYREYLDPDYLIPKVDKLVDADVNEPPFHHRVPGTVIYAHPGELLRIHVLNADSAPHSLHLHGLLYGIDSDGSWPFGTQNADGRRSDEICPGHSWTYTFCATEQTIGVWPFHDHSQHHVDESINRGLFGGIVVLPKGERAPGARKFQPIEDLKRLVARFDAPARLQPAQLRDVRKQIEWIKERWQTEIVKLPGRFQKRLHVPLFFHVMKSPTQQPKFDAGDIEELGGEKTLVFAEEGTFDYFCQYHPAMTGKVKVEAGGPATATVNILPGPPPAFSPSEITVGIGGSVTWVNQTQEHHTATSKDGASLATHCFNGRGFTGNSPTVVGWAGQKIRWYVFNLDVGTEWHNFHPHSSRWKLGAETIDVRSLGPAESFMVETEVPAPLLLTDEIKRIQKRKHRPRNAKLYELKGDFLFHCHVHHHMKNGMAGLIRARQRVWLTPEMAKAIEEKTGLPLYDGTNNCPKVDHHRCEKMSAARVERVPGDPEVIMMHAALVPGSEKVLIWGKTRDDQSRLWDAATNVFSSPANQPASLPGETAANSDLWSAAHAFLADGRLLAHGGLTEGAGARPTKTYLFDRTNAAAPWSRTGDTADARFYASTITLADGRLLTLHGNGGPAPVSNTIEVYDPGAGAWSAPKAMPAGFDYLYYPWVYLLPDGELFIAGPQGVSRKFDWTANPIVDLPAKQWPTATGDRGTNMNGTSVLLTLRPPDYRPVILIMGGSPAAARKSTEVMDLGAATPAWVDGPDLKTDRVNCTSVLLPNGHVFIAGGVPAVPDGGPVETIDATNLAAGWQVGPKLEFPRLYHSSMILLPDGSVLIGGDDDGADPCERYYPPYFNQPRPQVANAPAAVTYGAAFTVDTPQAGTIAEVLLMRPGAVTHGFDMSQRAVELAITASGAASVDVVAPPNGNVAPPGHYLLFVVDGSRVPSLGRWIHLGP
jgi:plastocyanin